MTDENLGLLLERFREFNIDIEARKSESKMTLIPCFIFFFLIIIHTLHLRSKNMQKTVADIFNNKCFSIPKYQRDYAWETKNIDDLWEDLLEAKNASNDSMGHFLGTIVVAKDQNSDVYHIIDGQQRGTTIFMLRYALNARTENPQRNINHFLDDNDNLRLQVAPANQEFFKALLTQADNNKRYTSLKDGIETDGQKRLYEVFERIWDRVGKLS